MRPPAAGTLDELLARTGQVMAGAVTRPGDGELRVGVDLGTAYTVVVVTDERGWPVAGAYRFAKVVRDGVVVNFHGAVRLLSALKSDVEERLGRPLTQAASGFPPGVARGSVRAVEHVLEGAGLTCSGLVDEPNAANAVLGVTDGAVVDVGGGTTGIAVFRNGELCTVADEPTGGTHVSLVLAGALGVPFDEAEELKRDPARAAELFPIVRPVFEKIGVIVRDVVAPFQVETVHLVGGTCRFPGIDRVVAETTGIRTTVPSDPLFVTGLGLAYHDRAPVTIATEDRQ
ncbi:MAG TPA: ethanolamine utilization protein EutJ [Actinoplanes sp.]|nr:ethanolamine utilization protein EutJ [Actinoplanes sp.]